MTRKKEKRGSRFEYVVYVYEGQRNANVECIYGGNKLFPTLSALMVAPFVFSLFLISVKNEFLIEV